jgi:thiaminase/transcriptional activator TenA
MTRSNQSIFDRLKESCGDEWRAYTDHEFIRQLGQGTLPEACFRHYLIQDYLFLIHFARAYALAAYKADTLEDMRPAAASLSATVATEMKLHLTFCEGWGLSAADVEAAPEANATIAYTRYVLERGLAGDLLDLHTALTPCVLGYAEIGRSLLADPQTRLEGNPYRIWIEGYGSASYQELAQDSHDYLDGLAQKRLTEARYPDLAQTFARATRLETQFWEMGLTLAP